MTVQTRLGCKWVHFGCNGCILGANWCTRVQMGAFGCTHPKKHTEIV